MCSVVWNNMQKLCGALHNSNVTSVRSSFREYADQLATIMCKNRDLYSLLDVRKVPSFGFFNGQIPRKR